MMESVRHRSHALPSGVAASAMLHVLIAAYLLFWITHPAPVADEPQDLSKAIPIMMMTKQPPAPTPPKPKPTQPPKPIPTPETIETTAVQQAMETPAEKVEPPPEPQVYEEPPPPAGATFAQLLRGAIEQEKRYPREALMSGDQGTAIVKFTLNRYGTILIFTIEKRTGSASLDAEVKRLMRRLKFPALPADEKPGLERIEYTIPIDFKLQ
jgi:protein TonB